MLCVRDGAFRVEYRVVLFDEKPCCALGCDVYLGYLEVPGQSPPPFVACPGILGGPRTVATPFCGVSYVCFSQQAHGVTMLCVRDGPFRVEYRVVLLDEKPCCA